MPDLASLVQDGVITSDLDDPDFVPEEPEKEEKPDKKEKEKPAEEPAEKPEEPEQKPEKAEDKEDKPEKKDEDPYVALKRELEESRREINRLGYALRKGEKKEDTKPVFTKPQLMQLMKEHADQPEVVFQIFEEMQKMGTADATKAAEKSLDIKTKRTEMEKALATSWPDYKDEGSANHQAIQSAVDEFHLEGHPFADFLSVAAMHFKSLPKIIEDIKTKTKEELLKTSEKDLSLKAEEARKKKIAENKPAGKGSASNDNKPATLTASQAETAKRLGFTTKQQLARYAKMVGAQSQTVSAGA